MTRPCDKCLLDCPLYGHPKLKGCKEPALRRGIGEALIMREEQRKP